MLQDTIKVGVSDEALVEELNRVVRLGQSLLNPYDREILECYVAELEARLAIVAASNARAETTA